MSTWSPFATPKNIKPCAECGHPRNMHRPATPKDKPGWKHHCYRVDCECSDYQAPVLEKAS